LPYYWGLAEKLPFPLRLKNGARKIKKCKDNFSARLRADALGGGATLRLGRLGIFTP
jgi:hypothetical protein